ncbi:MAG: ANTAR domain-containing protein [Clostridia bacterium]|nr:ANTAR domain-containing protein [Clostridia bacterium]
MNRLIVAFDGEKQREQIHEVLEGAGLSVRFVTDSASETVRLINLMGGGIVVTGGRLSGEPVDELAYRLGSGAMILALGSPAQLEYIDSIDVFKLSVPFSRIELISSVRILIQLEEKNQLKTVPRRTTQEDRLVASAKAKLMQSRDMTENEAHQYLQKLSMNTGRKLVQTAKSILETEAF